MQNLPISLTGEMHNGTYIGGTAEMEFEAEKQVGQVSAATLDYRNEHKRRLASRIR